MMLAYRMALLSLAVSFPILGFAQQDGPCRSDIQKYCAQVSGGPEKATDCLLDHQQDISDACYDALKSRLENQRGMHACKKDAQQFCKDIKPGGGRVMECLKDHQKEISDDCYELMSKRAQRKRP